MIGRPIEALDDNGGRGRGEGPVRAFDLTSDKPKDKACKNDIYFACV